MIHIVGLGNPGSKYLLNRHNVGFMAIDAFAQTMAKGMAFTSEHKSQTVKFQVGGQRVLLSKPQTYMNLSGEAVTRLITYYKLDPQNLLVIHDDIDLPLGTLKYQKNRGHGGHNGIRDIHKNLDTNEYYRLKLGVGRPANPRMNVADYVLQDFEDSEMPVLQDLLGQVCHSLECFILNGFEKAASEFNVSLKE